jgi:RimJ/RimL family protein N-acetyltransferase
MWFAKAFPVRAEVQSALEGSPRAARTQSSLLPGSSPARNSARGPIARSRWCGPVFGSHLSPSAILRGVQRLRTARLILTPLSLLDEAEHARASGDSEDAVRDTRAAELQWREHGFGTWAIRDLVDNSFLGGAELRFAGDGIEGIAPDEVEAGWWVTKNRRNQGIATEAMRVAIGDVWARAGVESVTAYIKEGEAEPSRRLAANLGFTMRSQGHGRFGEPMTVYELRRDVWDRRRG